MISYLLNLEINQMEKMREPMGHNPKNVSGKLANGY